VIIVGNWASAFVLIMVCIFGISFLIVWHDDRQNAREHEKWLINNSKETAE